MSDIRRALDKQAKLEAAAKKGPWSWRGGYLKDPYTNEEDDYYGSSAVISVNYAAQCPHLTVKKVDADLITHLRNQAKLARDAIEAAAQLVDWCKGFAFGPDFSPTEAALRAWADHVNGEDVDG